MKRRELGRYDALPWCFTDELSYVAGDVVELRISNPEGSCTITVERAGAEPELVYRVDGVETRHCPTDEGAYRDGCDWPVGHRFTVPAKWRSGYYRVRLETDTASAEHFFILRHSGPVTDGTIALVLATNTYHAYNTWGGYCLYGSDTPLSEPQDAGLGEDVATVVSTRRPFSRSLIAAENRLALTNRSRRSFGESAPLLPWISRDVDVPFWDSPAGFLNKWEHDFVRWAETNDYEVHYFAQIDLDHRPGCLAPYACYVSVGHDEYWTWAERDAVESYIASGGNAFFMSGNACYWQVRLDQSAHQMTCYKYRAFEDDPVVGTPQQHLMTGMWSDPAVGRPENQMMGTTFTRAGYSLFGLALATASGGYTIQRPNHWALAGTNVGYGDMFGQSVPIAGFELDGCAYTVVEGLPVPTGEDGTPANFEIIATAPASLGEPEHTSVKPSHGYRDASLVAGRIFGNDSRAMRDRARRGMATMGTFASGDGEVFTVGTTQWAYGLSAGEPYIDRITRNVLDRFGVTTRSDASTN